MSTYARRLKFMLEQVGPLRVSWMKEQPGGPTIATLTALQTGVGPNGYVTEVASESLRAAHSLVRICEAHDRVRAAREELTKAETALAEAFEELDDDRSGA